MHYSLSWILFNAGVNVRSAKSDPPIKSCYVYVSTFVNAIPKYCQLFYCTCTVVKLVRAPVQKFLCSYLIFTVPPKVIFWPITSLSVFLAEITDWFCTNASSNPVSHNMILHALMSSNVPLLWLRSVIFLVPNNSSAYTYMYVNILINFIFYGFILVE